VTIQLAELKVCFLLLTCRISEIMGWLYAPNKLSMNYSVLLENILFLEIVVVTVEWS